MALLCRSISTRMVPCRCAGLETRSLMKPLPPPGIRAAAIAWMQLAAVTERSETSRAKPRDHFCVGLLVGGRTV